MLGFLSSRKSRPGVDRSVATHLQVRLSEVGAEAHATALEKVLGDPRLQNILSADIVLESAEVPGALQDVLRAVLRSLPRAKSVEIVTRGAAEKYPLAAMLELHRVARERGASLTLGFVIDEDADAFEALGKRENSISRVFKASLALRTKGVKIRWWVPARAELAHRLEAIFSLAKDEWVDAVLVPTWCLPAPGGASAPLSEDDLLFIQDFIIYRLLEEEGATTAPERVAYYQWLKNALDGAGPRRPAGVRPVATVALSPDSAPQVLLENRPTLGDLASVGTAPDRKSAFTSLSDKFSDIGEVVVDGDRALLKWARSQGGVAAPSAPPLSPETKLRRIVVIGAYGGEHIGDMAILGGVLLRCHERFGTTDAVLMSQRADHTRRLVKNLDLPLSLTVEPYEHDQIKAAVSLADGVVYAGGPLMDLPKQLVLHLYTASQAQAEGKPLVLEGIGAGPFTRMPSEWIGRRLTTMASRISVRTGTDAEQTIMQGLNPEVGHDPAFDYLASRPEQLTRISEGEQADIERLLEDTQDKLLIGINLRPIREMFTAGAPDAAKRAEYTHFVVQRFEERLAEAMIQFSKVSDKKPCYIYYSMNSIQFGSPDLRSAYRVKRHCRNAVDFRVWQADPGIDGVVALLRRLDLAIAMRFHANIFALSQGLGVVGIDYRPGKRDKVDALHRDRGTIENVRRIDNMSTEWLVQRLTELAARRS